MWKRFLNGILKLIMIVSGIGVVIGALIAIANEAFLMGLIILFVGAFIVLFTCSGLGILVEIAYHLEAIEKNTSYSSEDFQEEWEVNDGRPWKCKTCGCLNGAKFVFCEKCGNKK